MITSITSETIKAMATAAAKAATTATSTSTTSTSTATTANSTEMPLNEQQPAVIGNDNVNGVVTVVATAMVMSAVTMAVTDFGDPPVLEAHIHQPFHIHMHLPKLTLTSP